MILRYILTYIIIIHTIYIASLLYKDYAGILEYPVSLPLVDWQVVYVLVHMIDAAINASPVNEYSSINYKYVNYI